MVELTASVQLKNDWELFEFSRRHEAAEREALKEGANVLQRQYVRQVGRIAARRIPTKREVAEHRQRKRTRKKRRRELKASSDPAWTRSGNTARGVSVAYPARNRAVIDVTGPAAVYAASREALGIAWMPKSPALGVVRRNAYATDTSRIGTAQAQKVFQQVYENRLRKR